MYGVFYARPAMGGRRWDALLTPGIMPGKSEYTGYGYSMVAGSLIPTEIDFLGTVVVNLTSGFNELKLTLDGKIPLAPWTVFSVLGVQYPRTSASYSEVGETSVWTWPTSAMHLFDNTQSNIPVALW